MIASTRNGNTITENPCTIENASTGLVSYSIDADVTKISGVMMIEAIVTFPHLQSTSNTEKIRVYDILK